jgi:peptidoglycan hydrolase CwlO-like protein
MKPNLDWDASVGKLWQKINLTYSQIKQLTADISLLDSRLKELESKIQFA